MQRPAVFLDRDGVLNRCFARGGVPHPPESVEAFELLPGVVDAVEKLRATGFVLIVVTNQPDVARGTQKRDVVEAMNAKLRALLAVDAIYVCYHDNADGCDCRKPKPGMLLEGAKTHQVDLSRSYMVGDRSGDIFAGKAAGCRTILIEQPYSNRDACSPDHITTDLSAAADWMLSDARIARKIATDFHQMHR